MKRLYWNICLRLGKYYAEKKMPGKAVSYFIKGQSAIASLDDRLLFAEQLHSCGFSDDALAYMNDVIRLSGSSRAYERRAHILRELGREEEAIADLEEAIKLDEDNYMNWYTRGVAYRDVGRMDEAISDLKESIKRESPATVVSTYYELAVVYYDIGRVEEAVIYFRKCIEDRGRAIPIYFYMLAKTLAELGQVDESIPLLQQGIEQLHTYKAQFDQGYSLFANSTNYSYGAFLTFQRQTESAYSFRMELAEAYMRQENYELAIGAVGEAMQLHPDASELYLRRAMMYSIWGKKRLAEADLEHFIKLEPDDHRGYAELAEFHRAHDQKEKAHAALARLYLREPDSPIVCYWMADSYYRLGQSEQALRLNDRLLSMEQDDALNYVQRADIYMQTGELSAAEQALTEAISIDADNPEIRSKKSYVLFLQHKNEDALLELQVAAELEPERLHHASHLTASGHIYRAMGLWDLAIDAYSAAIAADSDSPQQYEFRAECYVETGQMESGIADCTRGLELDRSYVPLYIIRSSIYLSLSDYAAARADTMQYLKYRPEDPGAYYFLGQIYYREHDEMAALQAFEHVLKLNPAHASSYLFKAYIYLNQLEVEEAVICIVNWSLHLAGKVSPMKKLEAVRELEGFDDSILEKAVDKISEMYGQQLYLS